MPQHNFPVHPDKNDQPEATSPAASNLGQRSLAELSNPSALSERLANGTENTDPGFMGPLDAVLIELPEGQRWVLFVTEKSEAGLASLGFLPG